MIEIIGEDKTCGKPTVFSCKCEACGCIFTAGLDDCELVTGKHNKLSSYGMLELKLRLKCPKCANALLYTVMED